MLESELYDRDSNDHAAGGRGNGDLTSSVTGASGSGTSASGPSAPVVSAPAGSAAGAPSVPAAVFQPPPVVLFQPPAPLPEPVRSDPPRSDSGRSDSGRSDSGRSDSGRSDGSRSEAGRSPGAAPADGAGGPGDGAGPGDDDEGSSGRRRSRRRPSRARSRSGDQDTAEPDGAQPESQNADAPPDSGQADGGNGPSEPKRSRSRSRRSRDSAAKDSAAKDGTAQDGSGPAADGETAADAGEASGLDEADASFADGEDDGDSAGSGGRRRRRKRRRGSADGSDASSSDDPPDTVVHVREPNGNDDVRSVKGSTRLEAKKQRRREGRETGRRRPPIITESEFLARRESVERSMVVRQRNDRTQIAVMEDGVLVEHYVNRSSHQSYVGNVYLGKVQNVLPSMEAAFVDIGKGRNAVLYAGEVNFDVSGMEGQPKRIESALKAGQSVIVQVTKDPVGHKGARLTSMVSLPGRYLVYVPGSSMTGISRKLPDTERSRLKQILKKVMPENAGVIVRTAAEGAAEEELSRDVSRLAAQWEAIEKKSKTASAPALLYSEPDLTIRVIRDVFNEDFAKLVVSGDEAWEVVDDYVAYVAPHLAERLTRWEGGKDAFAEYRIDEQLAKALERKVWLPSGGSLVIDKTEAMTVIDVNTGKFTGQGGNLEETVTRNNLEAAEEIVRQLRLRDIGGIVVIDFIDMVLESNRELVLRRLLECLARDRTKHQVAEVTSLGLVQMTRKRVGAGLLEAFSAPCECCNGRGVILNFDPDADGQLAPAPHTHAHGRGAGNGGGGGHGNGGNGNGNGGGNGGGGRGNGSRGSRSGPATPAMIAARARQADSPAAEGDGLASADGQVSANGQADDAQAEAGSHTENGQSGNGQSEPTRSSRRRRRKSSSQSSSQGSDPALADAAPAGQASSVSPEGVTTLTAPADATASGAPDAPEPYAATPGRYAAPEPAAHAPTTPVPAEAPVVATTAPPEAVTSAAPPLPADSVSSADTVSSADSASSADSGAAPDVATSPVDPVRSAQEPAPAVPLAAEQPSATSDPQDGA
jgi:ribonuclease E